MNRYDITILTSEAYLHPTEPDWYVQQIIDEDRLLRVALERKGLRVHRIDWTSRHFDWSETSAVIFRSVWDYPQHIDEFKRFIVSISEKTILINPLSTIMWNLDKHYLRDLNDRGIETPKTIYIEKGDEISLQQLHADHGLTDSILKPVMSAGARHTYRLNKHTLEKIEPMFQELISSEAMMLQPFLHSVLTHGEITLVVIGGTFTHAVLKSAKSGDFRVQDDFGGTVQPYNPTKEEISFAEKVVSVCEPLPYYARVDLLRNNDDDLVVSELELIEPELWFRFHPASADILADTIKKMF